MTHQVKASSAGSTMRRANSLGCNVRQALAIRACLPAFDGSGAPSTRSIRLLLATVAGAMVLAVLAAPASAAAPLVTVQNATNVEYTTAEVAGTVDPGGKNTGWRFEYITDAQFQENVTHSLPGFSGASVPFGGSVSSTEAVSGTIYGLHAGTTYHLRLFAKNVNGFDTAVAANFTTNAVTAPVVTEVEAIEVEYATFAAKGKVEISGSDSAFNASTCRFEAASQQQWEDSGNAFPEGPFENGSEEPVVGYCHPPGEPYSGIEPSGPGTTEVEANFNGPEYSPYNPPPYIRIRGGTTYHLRLVAGNQSGAPTAQEAGSTFETKPVAKPTITGLSASSITATSAHVSATVAPNAPGPVTDAVKAGYNVHWFFTCTPDCGRPEGEIEAGEPGTEVSADLGLGPNLHYTVTLHAINAGGDETSQTTVNTPAVAPEVMYPFSGSAIDRTTSGARLVGLVNPHNASLTDCHFDYGETTSYGKTLPCVGAPTTGNGFSFVTAEVGGLEAGTTYHFRLVAGNATGPAVGGDKEFKTFPTVSPPSCGNEEVRAEQHAQSLPECRAWEMSSPLDKNGGNITGEASNVIAATDGDGVVFASRAGFAGELGTGPVGITQYVSNRGDDGWTTRGISPVPNPGAFQTLFSRDEAGVFSEDVSKAVMWGYDLPGATGDIPHETNIYQEDTGTGALRTVTQAAQMGNPPFFPQYINLNAVGASADVEVISFPSTVQLLPNAPEGVENAYEWDDGTLRLAGILPDGSVPSEGSSLPESNAPWYRYRESVSSDGSRVSFLSRKEGWNQLYLRRDHTSTAWVSEAEGTGATAAENVRLQWMSPDGEHLLFTTTSQLLPSDTDGLSDLYLYTDGPNPSAESNLELITDTTRAPEREAVENAVLGASDDASRIYYVSEECGCGLDELNYWHNGVNQRLVDTFYGQFSGGATSYPGEARVSRDGLTLAFLSEQQVTGDQTNGLKEMYVYDAATDSLSCASCMASGSTDAPVPSEPRATQQGLTKEMPQVRPHWLSNDGRHVFFTTAGPLVSGDINGLPDVYSYNTETGEQRLLSSGKGEEAAWFENASDSGSDVFMVTNQHLVGMDTDELWDIYDARVEGGFPEPPPPPTACSGDGCRGTFSSPPDVNSPATSSFSGPGNPQPKRRKHRKRHKHRKHHGKHHHQKRHRSHGGKRRNGAGK